MQRILGLSNVNLQTMQQTCHEQQEALGVSMKAGRLTPETAA